MFSKNLFLFSLFFSLLILHAPVQSQNLNRYLEKKMQQAAKRAGQKADKEVTDEMNKQVDKGVESIFDAILEAESDQDSNPESSQGENYSNESSEDMAAAMLKSMGVSMEAANVADSYSFTGMMQMELESFDAKGNSEELTDYKTYFPNDAGGFAMEFAQDGQESFILFDALNSQMIILSDANGQKTGMVTSYDTTGIGRFVEDYEDENVDYTHYRESLVKTGRTKSIAGYQCHEYRHKEDQTELILWMTEELPADLYARMFSFNTMIPSNKEFFGGFIMEMDDTNLETGERTTMTVTEVDLNHAKTFSTRGYQIMSFGMNIPENTSEKGQED